MMKQGMVAGVLETKIDDKNAIFVKICSTSKQMRGNTARKRSCQEMIDGGKRQDQSVDTQEVARWVKE